MPKNRIVPAVAVLALVPLSVWAQGQTPGSPATQAPAQGQPAAPTTTTAPGLSPTSPASLLTPPPAAAQVPAAPATPAVEPPTEAETQLDEAIKRVQALKAVSADIEQRVSMLGQNFSLKGEYIRGPKYQIYLKLSVQGLGDTSGTMLQVCDGQTLWELQQVLNSKSYSRLDFGKVIKRIESPDFDAELREQIIGRVGFGGPDALLVGLRKSLKFDRKEAETLDGRKVWVLRGQWKDLQQLGVSNPGAAAAAAGNPNAPGGRPAGLPQASPALPPYIPSLATVYVGQEDGWPYKVVLEGRVPSLLEDNRMLDANGRPLGAKGSGPKVQPSKIVLLYSNVKLNPELTPASFAYEAPPGESVLDSTDQLLISLEQAAAARADQKKAEASKESELPQSIPVPGLEPSETPPPVKGSDAATGAGKASSTAK